MAYYEVQRFPPTFLAIIVCLILAVGMILSLRMSGAERLASLTATLLPALLIIIFYFAVQLRTSVTNDSVNVRMTPFGGQEIALEDIRTVEVVDYRPLRDFGGWGVRFGRKGKIYNARGDRAVKLSMTDKSTLFIGSSRPEQLANVISARTKS